MTLHPAIPVTGIKDLIAYDKAYPDKLRYGVVRIANIKPSN